MTDSEQISGTRTTGLTPNGVYAHWKFENISQSTRVVRRHDSDADSQISNTYLKSAYSWFDCRIGLHITRILIKSLGISHRTLFKLPLNLFRYLSTPAQVGEWIYNGIWATAFEDNAIQLESCWWKTLHYRQVGTGRTGLTYLVGQLASPDEPKWFINGWDCCMET